jgi:hypothetical protein
MYIVSELLLDPQQERTAVATNVVFAQQRFSRPHNVDLNAPSAITYWCRYFKTTPERLGETVRRVGRNPSVVQRALLRG